MKKSRYNEEQIIGVLKRMEAGQKAREPGPLRDARRPYDLIEEFDLRLGERGSLRNRRKRHAGDQDREAVKSRLLEHLCNERIFSRKARTWAK